MSSSRKRRVVLVQQGVWDMPVESMPLACGYLKAIVSADPEIGPEVDVEIANFKGADSPLTIVERLFRHGKAPDVLGFSVFGWSYITFGKIAETFKQLNPDGWVIFGGTHVSHQAERTFSMFPEVNIVVNNEGELTFRELMAHYVAGGSKHALHGINGVSFRDEGGATTTTAQRERLIDLDVIPSPLLTGAIPISDEHDAFRYDVGLMETNRGCPYKCAFCYWGGAVGQKLRKFSIDRLTEELDFYGYHKIVNVVLCDSNFGMLREDQLFVEALIKTREKYGFPKHLETSWAKNKGKIFFEIVKQMRQHGFRSSFTLALQTLTKPALSLMGRKNMKVNDWEDLAHWLDQQGLECYAELIWGVPGETYETFLEGYDKLARHMHRIATYPLLLMPNTDYTEKREQYGFVLVRGDDDDFQYVLSHNDMTLEENRKAHRFLFWARILAENSVLRYIWRPTQALTELTQSALLVSLDQWLDRQEGPVASGLRACRREIVDNLDASRVTRGLHFCYLEPGFAGMLVRWWEEEILPQVSPEHVEFFRELLIYDLATRPMLRFDSNSPSQARVKRWRRRGDDAAEEELSTAEIHGEEYLVRKGVEITYDIPEITRKLIAGEDFTIEPSPVTIDLHFKVGFAKFVDNHEFVVQYVGKTRAQLTADRERAEVHGLDRQQTFGQRGAR